MKKPKKQLLVIVGPTATGKTSLGIYLAKKLNAEIVSADSRQVYQGMDIVTGKDININSKLKTQNSKLGIKKKDFTVGYRRKNQVPIWLVDIVKPSYVFNVGEYANLAKKVIKYIQTRNKLPIIVGGTGLYVKSLTHKMDFAKVPPDFSLRKKLSEIPVLELQKFLKKINIHKWKNMNRSDKHNPRRLIRAIEITKKLQISYQSKIRKEKSFSQDMDIFMIGLTTDIKSLYSKIDKRVDTRIKQGAISEIEALLSCGYSFDLTSFSSIGYIQMKDYFQTKVKDSEEKNKILNKCIDKWKKKEKIYVKRQLTWFKKIKDVIWFDISDENLCQNIEKTVRRWYT